MKKLSIVMASAALVAYGAAASAETIQPITASTQGAPTSLGALGAGGLSAGAIAALVAAGLLIIVVVTNSDGSKSTTVTATTK